MKNHFIIKAVEYVVAIVSVDPPAAFDLFATFIALGGFTDCIGCITFVDSRFGWSLPSFYGLNIVSVDG